MATQSLASSPGGRNDRLVSTVMRMRIIIIIIIHNFIIHRYTMTIIDIMGWAYRGSISYVVLK